MKKSILIFHWTPRILCMAAILFISLFSFDAFDPKLSAWEQIGGFLIHLVPSVILAAFLAVAWKWELVGGIILSILGLGFTPLIFMGNYQWNNSWLMSLGIVMIITFPFVVVGGLFIFSHFLKKKNGVAGQPED